MPEPIMDASLRKFKVGSVRLKEGNLVIDVTAFQEPGEEQGMLAEGWLCFDSEMDFILYLDRVWFRCITELKFKRNDSGTKQVIGILKKALPLATEEQGFKTDALKGMVLSGIAGLAGIYFS